LGSLHFHTGSFYYRFLKGAFAKNVRECMVYGEKLSLVIATNLLRL